MDMSDWYWAAQSGGNAGDRFVIVNGLRSLWPRVRGEISADERCAWLPIGAKGKPPTLADCFEVWMHAREQYGVNYNRLTLELAQVPAFADWLRTRTFDLCNYVSNPCDTSPLIPRTIRPGD
jgi:hypothetical protein